MTTTETPVPRFDARVKTMALTATAATILGLVLILGLDRPQAPAIAFLALVVAAIGVYDAWAVRRQAMPAHDDTEKAED